MSSAGVLVEGEARLLPGTHLEVHVVARGGRTLVRSRVIRAAVAELQSDRVLYRAALAFEQLVDVRSAPSEIEGSVLTVPDVHPVPSDASPQRRYQGTVYPVARG
jgi:hypothetical protein